MRNISAKRFIVDKVGIYDNQEEKSFKFIAYDWVDCDIYECCEKLNEQQATIQKQSERIRELESILADDIVRKSEIKDAWKQRTEKRWNDE